MKSSWNRSTRSRVEKGMVSEKDMKSMQDKMAQMKKKISELEMKK